MTLRMRELPLLAGFPESWCARGQRAVERRKACPTECTLVVRVAPDNLAGADAICIEFANNGPGIAPAALEKIFDPYCHTSGRHGAGLAIARQTIAAHNGVAKLTVSLAPALKFVSPAAPRSGSAIHHQQTVMNPFLFDRHVRCDGSGHRAAADCPCLGAPNGSCVVKEVRTMSAPGSKDGAVN